MFSAKHRTSFSEKATSGRELGAKVTKHIFTDVTYPSSLEDLAALEDGSLKLKLPLGIDWAGEMEVCVGYEQDATGKFVGVYQKVPTAVGLIIEALKLRINAAVRPAGGDGSEVLEAYLASLPPAKAEFTREILAESPGVRKAVVAKAKAWAEQQAENDAAE